MIKFPEDKSDSFYNLIDTVAQRADGMQYSWSDSDKEEMRWKAVSILKSVYDYLDVIDSKLEKLCQQQKEYYQQQKELYSNRSMVGQSFQQARSPQLGGRSTKLTSVATP